MEELLIKLKDQYISDNVENHKIDWCVGICYSIDKLYWGDKITQFQRGMLEAYFLTQKPSETIHQDFLGDGFVGKTWWWRKSSWGYNKRIEFLDKLISINKTK